MLAPKDTPDIGQPAPRQPDAQPPPPGVTGSVGGATAMPAAPDPDAGATGPATPADPA
jgi:hypothetical protein